MPRRVPAAPAWDGARAPACHHVAVTTDPRPRSVLGAVDRLTAWRHVPARVHLVLMLVLTFSTGIIDAVGYLGLDRVFTANMTGNVVILGMGLVGGDGLPVLGPALALGGYTVGAALGGRILGGVAGRWGHRSTTAFAVTGVLATALGVSSILVVPHGGTPWAFVVTTALAVAMGVQAAAARRLGVKDVTTVVVTSALTGLASDSRIAGGTGEHGGRRFLAVALILAGAAVGAVLLHLVGERGVGVGMLVAGAVNLATAFAGHHLRDADRPPRVLPS